MWGYLGFKCHMHTPYIFFRIKLTIKRNVLKERNLIQVNRVTTDADGETGVPRWRGHRVRGLGRPECALAVTEHEVRWKQPSVKP